MYQAFSSQNVCNIANEKQKSKNYKINGYESDLTAVTFYVNVSCFIPVAGQ